MIDTNNPIVQLCVEGSQAEFVGQPELAKQLYEKAWAQAGDDFEKCVAAHYVARFQESAEDTLAWNLAALAHAEKAPQELVADFYPSLYLNLGRDYELVGDLAASERYYGLAGR